MSWNRLRDRSASSAAGAVATFVLALGALAVVASTAGAGMIRHVGGPLARTASPTGDCDNDGDNPLGVEFEECSPLPAEPDKVYTPAQKAQFAESADNAYRSYNNTCGAGPSDPLWYLQILNLPLLTYCTSLVASNVHESALVKDPPGQSLFLVALPSVSPLTGGSQRCTLRAAACRRGRELTGAYLYAFEQQGAALGALATTLNRLSSTPAKPESRYGTGAGSIPLDSRLTQAAAAKLYSGLAAAWSDRLRIVRANLVRFLDGLGRNAKRAARHLPAALPSAPLWAAFHKMNVFEVAQLASDFIDQNVLGAGRPSGQLGAELASNLAVFEVDIYKVHVASTAPRAVRTERLDSTARGFKHWADRFATIPGFASAYPNGPLCARLFGFAVEGLTRSKPAPVAAP